MILATKKIFPLIFAMLCLTSIGQAQKSSGGDALPESPVDVFIPNAFTPDGNGLNDSFGTVVNGPQLDLYELIVLDRNGKEVFYTTNPDENWNGTIKGSSYTSGSSLFIYILKIKSIEDPSPMIVKGHVVLLR